eukprot:Opistho-2@96395
MGSAAAQGSVLSFSLLWFRASLFALLMLSAVIAPVSAIEREVCNLDMLEESCPEFLDGIWSGQHLSPIINPSYTADFTGTFSSSDLTFVIEYDNSDTFVYDILCSYNNSRFVIDFLVNDTVEYRGIVRTLYASTSMSVFLLPGDLCARAEYSTLSALRESYYIEWDMWTNSTPYLGCYPEDTVSVSTIVAGASMPHTHPVVCAAKCAAAGYDFSGVVDGITCTCTNDQPDGSRVADSLCGLVTCDSSIVDVYLGVTCGGAGYYSVFETSNAFAELNVTMSSTLSIGDEFTISVSAMPFAFDTVMIYYGDDNYDVITGADSIQIIQGSNRYSKVGWFKVTVIAAAPNAIALADRTKLALYEGQVSVYAHPHAPSISPIEPIYLGDPGSLSFGIRSGTGMFAQIIFEDNAVDAYVLDAPAVVIGYGPLDSTLAADTLTTYVDTAPITQSGVLSKWIFRTNGAGPVYFQVWRVQCQGGKILCTRWNGPNSFPKCVDDVSDCIASPGCGGSTTYCAAGKTCALSDTCEASCPDASETFCERTATCESNITPCGTWDGSVDVVLVGQTYLNNVGSYNEIVTLDTSIDVQAGDFIGFTQNQDGVVRGFEGSYPLKATYFQAFGDISTAIDPGVSTMTLSSADVTSNGYAFSAIVESPREGTVQFTPTVTGKGMDATLRVWNELSYEESTVLYDVYKYIGELSDAVLDFGSAGDYVFFSSIMSDGAGANFSVTVTWEDSEIDTISLDSCPMYSALI